MLSLAEIGRSNSDIGSWSRCRECMYQSVKVLMSQQQLWSVHLLSNEMYWEVKSTMCE